MTAPRLVNVALKTPFETVVSVSASALAAGGRAAAAAGTAAAPSGAGAVPAAIGVAGAAAAGVSTSGATRLGGLGPIHSQVKRTSNESPAATRRRFSI